MVLLYWQNVQEITNAPIKLRGPTYGLTQI